MRRANSTMVYHLGHSLLSVFSPSDAAREYNLSELVAVGNNDLETQARYQETVESEGSGPFPFPLLSGAHQQVFRAYRAYDDFEEAPLHCTFLVEAAELARWQDISFEPFSDGEFLLREAQRMLALPAP